MKIMSSENLGEIVLRMFFIKIKAKSDARKSPIPKLPIDFDTLILNS